MVNGGRLKLFARIVISGALVGYLTFVVNWSSVLASLRDVDPALYAESTFFVLIGVFLLALQYYLLLRSTSLSRSFVYLVKINVITRFYALFLPSVTGQEATRWYKITQNRQGRGFFLAAICYERLLSVFFLVLFGAIPLYFLTGRIELVKLKSALQPFVLLLFVADIGGIAYFVIPVRRWVAAGLSRWPLPADGRWRKVTSLIDQFSLEGRSVFCTTSVMVLSLLWQISFLLRMYCLYRSMGLEVGFWDVAWMSSLVALLQLAPVSFSGIGLREGAFAFLFSAFHLPEEEGVSLGVLVFSQMLIFASAGGMVELFENRNRYPAIPG